MANTAILTSQEHIDAVPEITTEQGSSIISRTHAALAMAVLAISLSQNIKAQEVQKETTPPVTAKVEKPVSKEIPGATITFEFRVPEKKQEVKQLTKDGREYAKLTEKEVDELSDEEYDKFRKWDKSRLVAKLLVEEQRLAENKEKAITTTQLADKEWEKAITTTQLADKEWEKTITEEQRLAENKEKVIAEEQRLAENKEKVIAIEKSNLKLEAKIVEINSQITASRLEMWTKASLSIAPLLERVNKWEKGIKIDPDLKEAIIMIADGKLPPPGMQENAKKLVPFLA
jgi:hypothetical protein